VRLRSGIVGMKYIDEIVGKRSINKMVVASVLEESLSENDIFSKNSFEKLLKLGFKDDEALILLASHKSQMKYGYRLSLDTLKHILGLSQGNSRFSPIKNLIKSPFLYAKTGWLYEHAPYFVFYNKYEQEELDSYILKFVESYQSLFLTSRAAFDLQEKLTDPRRVLASSFWEKEIWDPVEMILWAARNNLAGLELNVDFHPFNYAKLLPEEFSEEKRQDVKNATLRSGIKLDIHSPIVGPYSPFPNPDNGKPLFYDPLECLQPQRETIFLARDIGAGSVIVHLIDLSGIKEMANLIMTSAGSPVRVTIENYCETRERQDADTFISFLNEVCNLLPKEVIRDNLGVTLDVGHLNIEGEDPLIGAEKIGRWCKDKEVFLRMHATDNYGKLLFSPPHYSADVHGNVSGKGINNSYIIKLLRYMGLDFDVLAEQIQPLTPDDIALIDQAQRFPIKESYESAVEKGNKRLSTVKIDSIINQETKKEKAYQFLAGIEDVGSLREYLLYRKIQIKKYFSVDEARKSSLEFMKSPQSFKLELMEYIDDLLAPVQRETGLIDRSKMDLIYQNISGALFGRVNKENLNQIFYRTKTFNQGDIVFEQYSKGTEIYYIKEGEVSAIIDGLNLATLGAGEIFGEISLFYNIKRTTSIKVTKDNTKIGILPRDEFEDILVKNRRYAYDLIYRLFNTLPHRLRNLNEKYKTAMITLRHFLESDLGEDQRLENMISQSQFVKTSLPNLSLDDIEKLFVDKRAFGTDEEIFAEGDTGDGVYFILGGKVRVITLGGDLKEVVLGELEAGQIFGEMALIDDKPRSASVIPSTPCEVAFMSKKKFDYLIQTKSDLAYRFMSSVCLSIFRHTLRLNTFYLKVKKEFQ
jgi:CRP-like cAMP-binding protein/sugar phosphate isomerase/epimerase